MKTNNRKKCPACGVEQSKWGSDAGRGITVSGVTYCCEGCFTLVGCVCAEIKQRALVASHAQADAETDRWWLSEGSPD